MFLVEINKVFKKNSFKSIFTVKFSVLKLVKQLNCNPMSDHDLTIKHGQQFRIVFVKA